MRGVTHKLFRGRKDAFNLRLKSCFHIPTRLNNCSGSQVECSSLAGCTLLLSAASTKERRMSRNAGVKSGVILCRSVRHVAREEVLERGSIYFMGQVKRGLCSL